MSEPLAIYAWVGEDEYGSGKVGIKQGMVPAGIIPLAAMDYHLGPAGEDDARDGGPGREVWKEDPPLQVHADRSRGGDQGW